MRMGGGGGSMDETKQLIHELEVHQIELEMQNKDLRRTHEELDAERARYFDLYDLAPVGYFTLNGNGVILEANLMAATLLGVERGSLVKQPLTRFIFPEDQDIFYRYHKKIFKTGAPQAYELRMVIKGGAQFWAHLASTAVQDNDGASVFRIVLSDNPERKQAETYRELGREVLQILNKKENRDDLIQRVLAAMKARTAFDAVGIRLQAGDDFPYCAQQGFPKDFLQTENTLIAHAADGGLCRDKDGKVSLECTCGLIISGKTDPAHPFFTRGGSFWTNCSFPLLDLPSDQDPRLHPRNQCILQGYASVALVPIRSSDGIVGLIQLNDRRKGCFTLNTVELLEEISSYIGEALMRIRAEDLLQRKNDELIRFNYAVSHDLKSPLVTIKTFIGYLESDMAKADTERVAQDFSFINTAAIKMNDLLEELLGLSRIGRTTNLAVEVSLQDIMLEALALVAGRIAQRSVRVQVTKEPKLLYGDRVRLVEVFQNLIDNAVKFMGDQSEPMIEIGAETKNGEAVCFVRDNGLGIDPRHKDKLFGLFEKLNPKIEGTGLGLALVKRIVEVHGGRIWVESEGLGKGSCFWFTLPNKQGSKLMAV